MNRSAEGAREKVRTARNPLQWAAAAASTLLVLGAIGVLVRDGFVPDRPPDFEIRFESPRAVGDAFHLPLSIRNTGDQTVAGLGIQVALLRGDSTVAEGEVTLEWLPARSTREATVVFGRDPRGYVVVANIRGYRMP